MQVEVTDADRELFVKLTGYDSNSIDAILSGNAFTWEAEQIARHRIAERERVLAELADLQEKRLVELETKFGGRDGQ